MTSTNLLYIYVIIINVVTFFIYGLDKSRAKAGQWRIPEAQLIFLAVIGGSVGALAGMKVFHHKTRKPKFKTGVPAILIIQLIIYFLFSGLEVSDKKTEPVAGGTVTSFRFNLSNDTSYEIIYCAEAVKSGRLKLPEEKLDYFTAADIESYWDNYQYEIVPVSENELPGQEETQEWDKIPMVMVDGKLYYDTGKESTISGRCGVMDGEITSSVDGSEIPTKDNQSNFGTGFEYQYGADNTIEIFMNEKWIVFEQREGDGSKVRYGDRMVDAEDLSKETLEWLDWYNSLPEEQQLAVSFVPSDLIEETGPVKTEDAEVPAQEEELCGYPLAPEEVE